MKKIKLTQNKFALVSNEDYEYLNQWKWCAHRDRKTFYAVRTVSKGDRKYKTICMHQVIAERMGIKNPDHADTNGLNNQRSNLRAATRSQQGANRNKGKNNTSGYKGVSWHKRDKKWVSRIKISGKLIHLGNFDDIKDAAKAYNEAAIKYFGEFAVLNKV